MKDLFVLTADADMLVVFRTILGRPDALGIRPISFAIDRHANRDAGVFRNGPELLRAIPKGDFRYFAVAFDHDGSGCNRPPDDCATSVQCRLDSFTFKDRSTAIVIAPELEEWLWHDTEAIANNVEVDAIPGPKERLRQVFRRKPLPRDFEQIAARANLQAWDSSPSFHTMKTTLQNWFPRT
jgi:hypothetical protein